MQLNNDEIVEEVIVRTKTLLKELISSLSSLDGYLRKTKENGVEDKRRFVVKLSHDKSFIIQDKKFKQFLHYKNELLKGLVPTRDYELTTLIQNLNSMHENFSANMNIKDAFAKSCVTFKSNVELLEGESYEYVTPDLTLFNSSNRIHIATFDIPSLAVLKEKSENYSKSIDLKFDTETSSLDLVLKKWSRGRIPTYERLSNAKINYPKRFGYISIPFSAVNLSSKSFGCSLSLFRLAAPTEKGDVFLVELETQKTKEITYKSNYTLLNIPYYNV